MLTRSRHTSIIGLTLILLAVLISAQISPGKLALPHAHLEGISNCKYCHVPGEKVTDEKCLNCHQLIGTLIAEQRGYHASSEVRPNACIQCHSDHHGREFEMIRFDTNRFEHVLTGFELHGVHAGLVCRECHHPRFITDQGIKSKPSTFLGLHPACLSCHEDYHLGTLSQECASCHDYNSFSPATGFDHNRTGFPLVGKHSDVECIECHRMINVNGISMQQFAGVPYQNCTSCHRDVHDNKFGQNCIRCHTEESFHLIKTAGSFNHSMTDFPLEGRHKAVDCADCHASGYTTPIKHQYCADCHADYHERQFERQGSSPDCSDCHTTMGFERSYYTIERHNQGDFKLSGAHLATPCTACHMKGDRWSFRQIGRNCMDCHANIHESHMDKRYYQEEGCRGCHNTMRWIRIDFDHARTGFMLEGAHLRQSCRSCHLKKDEKGNAWHEFSQLTPACIGCHRDIHNGQFTEPGGMVCLSCHDYDDWTARRFDHDLTAFPLVGKHRDVACYKCHLPVATAELTYIQYKIKDHSCESCH